jgi:hypothetical protein
MRRTGSVRRAMGQAREFRSASCAGSSVDCAEHKACWKLLSLTIRLVVSSARTGHRAPFAAASTSRGWMPLRVATESCDYMVSHQVATPISHSKGGEQQ